MFRRTLAAGIALLAGLGGCTAAPDPSEPLPDARILVSAAAETLRTTSDVRFRFGVSGHVPGLTVRGMQGAATASGWAKGTVDVQRGRHRADYEFVVEDGVVRLHPSSGGKAIPGQPGVFELGQAHGPARILDPERGLRRLLVEATQLRTETREPLNGTETFRITGELPQEVITDFVPGIWSDVTVKFWVGAQAQHRLHRIWIQIPPRQPNEGAVMIELALSEFEPADTTAPSPR